MKRFLKVLLIAVFMLGLLAGSSMADNHDSLTCKIFNVHNVQEHNPVKELVCRDLAPSTTTTTITVSTTVPENNDDTQTSSSSTVNTPQQLPVTS